MATEVCYPLLTKGVTHDSLDWDHKNVTFEEQQKKEDKLMGILNKDHDQALVNFKLTEDPRKLTGLLLRFPIADGSALYRVMKCLKRKIEVQLVPYADAYQALDITIKGIDYEYLVFEVKRSTGLKAMFS